MKLLEPSVPTGKGAMREAADDFAGAAYVVAVGGAAILAVGFAYRWAKNRLQATRQLAASTAQSASSGLQALLG